MVRYKKSTVNALEKVEMIFTRLAISAKIGSSVKMRPTSKNRGAPGGCGTASLKEQAINSPQSQNETVGATVE